MSSVTRIRLDDAWHGRTTKAPHHLRFVCISDTHGSVSAGGGELAVPDGDVLVHAGDFTTVGTLGEVQQFDDFLSTLPHPRKIVIAGNHDVTFDTPFYKQQHDRFHFAFEQGDPRELLRHCTYLQDSGTSVAGIKVWGSPWTPVFCDWAFNLPRGEQLRRKWDDIPDDTDIVITHGPAAGHGDLCDNGCRAGCRDLLERLQHVKPKYLICGHIHEDYGVTHSGDTFYVNASTCNLYYEPVNRPIVFDVPLPE
mmetsp:Transcript_140/g.439  ORF Transcript_140/g.439 Transcript_140/m.439 type:complete len:252 (+) Transcript_140:145-900(+)